MCMSPRQPPPYLRHAIFTVCDTAFHLCDAYIPLCLQERGSGGSAAVSAGQRRQVWRVAAVEPQQPAGLGGACWGQIHSICQ